MTEKRYTISMESDETIQLGVKTLKKGVAVEDRKTACGVYRDKKQNVENENGKKAPKMVEFVHPIFIIKARKPFAGLNRETKLRFTLKSLSQTRWSCLCDAAEALKDNYSNIMNILKTFSDNEMRKLILEKRQ
ncbi:hypothetical protein TNCV_4610661 [Trichonephila clavipes]|nr:hypothetical protein TNCV_4610661 [Trichonephila clavipes]